MRIQVKDIMMTPVKTSTIKSDAGYLRELMDRKDVHAIPIVEVMGKDDVKIRGIVTGTDLRGITDETTSAELFMTKKVHVISPEANAQSAAKMMLRHEVHHLVVMNEGAIIGMLSALDFVKLVAEHELS